MIKQPAEQLLTASYSFLHTCDYDLLFTSMAAGNTKS